MSASNHHYKLPPLQATNSASHQQCHCKQPPVPTTSAHNHQCQLPLHTNTTASIKLPLLLLALMVPYSFFQATATMPRYVLSLCAGCSASVCVWCVYQAPVNAHHPLEGFPSGETVNTQSIGSQHTVNMQSR